MIDSHFKLKLNCAIQKMKEEMHSSENEPGISECPQHLLGLIQVLVAEEWPQEPGVGAAPSQQGMVSRGTAKALAQLLGQGFCHHSLSPSQWQ